MNNKRVPNCCYCDKPLDPVNDSCAEGGFWSAHFSTCVHPVKDGKYAVVNDRGTYARYTTLKRAEAQAEYLRRFNSGVVFKVVVCD